ncbi:MAG: polymer-forming cytoskeletal protein [Chloroflexota bacterium]|nr:polymer-forming cytoskeletal protein [Chloroflexota bacterium]
MFNFNRSQRPEPDAIEVIIGPRATFSGALRCDTSIRIDGAVESGHVETPANVVLTETARVQCDITARTVSIRGIYRGTIRADRVEVLQGSQIYGALFVNSFFMDDGVLMRAELNIQNAGVEEPTLLSLRPDSTATIPVIKAFRNKG